MSRGWLSGLVRARQVQEDLARQRLATARNDALAARRAAVAEDDRIDAMTGALPPESALAFVAAAAARQAAAMTWSAARLAEAAAHDHITVAETVVVGAARDRRSVEKLQERVTEEARVQSLSDAQDELDDIAARSFESGAMTDVRSAR
jgi:hypothetical protein